MKTSELAEGLKGSEIIKIAGEVNALKAQGEVIYNQTIGDFNPNVFPIPVALKSAIIDAYEANHTNYPTANGMQELRDTVSSYLSRRLGLDYASDEILISGGARPLIYATYQTVLDISDKVLYPVPSWNNDAYTYLARNNAVVVETKPEHKFMPTVEDIKPQIRDVNLVALCSPLNPTGTTFTKEALSEICDLVIAENVRRQTLNIKPLYVLYDQIYWQLTYNQTQHYNPVELNSEMRDYTIFVDGISKAFASTGVRVGWAFGPKHVISKMKAMLSHIGAWSPKAEQIATASFLKQDAEVSKYLGWIKGELDDRLISFYNGFQDLKSKGYSVDAIEPEAALYLTVQFDLVGKTTQNGQVLEDIKAVTSYLLNEAKLAVVPFYAFGTSLESNWFRLSVGTAKKEDISTIFKLLEEALNKLS
ncbi:aminotransferase class I/II-fold pyridoxal phosphate-dependent enzyme [Ichthyenterobacterium sp. W332]|uniref:Aminotransferase class I/II-fold pyridoxal phosphate-dependent enzyme n=1 Tax=Microcosmobacter mediterraneus TaxID=3075607 RepID=A0ABU2YLV2_9FLAO|nr:aminotransferase class I/II-fold pyridoxal phosphate-dependent enzyme [Ichthyenterobacterium sp. W332]MDT0559017.1 aminotransferase class I/II-fold pyridoxal phosphate-dependent enzyme [Ichthyenterobacterium sp. W332]